MRTIVIVSVFMLSAFAQEQTSTAQQPTAKDEAAPTSAEAPGKVLNIAIERIGVVRGDMNYVITEFFQIRDLKLGGHTLTLIGPDFYCIGFNNLAQARGCAGGGGLELHPAKWLTIDHEEYVEVETGSEHYGRTYILPWTRIEVLFGKKLHWETVPFWYLPVGGSGQSKGSTQFVLERSVLEYQLTKRFSVELGYAAYQDIGAAAPFSNNPLAGAAWKTEHAGKFEGWIQPMVIDVPHHGPMVDWRIQFRHSIAFHTRH